MKKFSLLLVLLFSSSAIKTELNKNIKALSIIIPLNATATYLGYKMVQWSKADKILAQQIADNPVKNLNAIRDFCYNYKKQALDANGKATWITDDSLSLQFVNLKDKDGNFNPAQLQEFANLISKKINDKSNGSTVMGYILPIITFVGSAIYLNDLNK